MNDEPVCACSVGYRCGLCRELDHVYLQVEMRQAAAAEAAELEGQKLLARGVLAAIREHLPAEMVPAAERVLRTRDGASYLAALLQAEDAMRRGEAGDVLAEADSRSNWWRGIAL
jgi:hypothetical protein